jgi:hypothetical protein
VKNGAEDPIVMILTYTHTTPGLVLWLVKPTSSHNRAKHDNWLTRHHIMVQIQGANLEVDRS